MSKKQILSICAAFFASQLLASTIYIGSDGNFYDANSGGTQVSYTTGDTIDWQTGVTTWNVNSVVDVRGATFVAKTGYTINIGADGSLTADTWRDTLGQNTLITVSAGGSFHQYVPATDTGLTTGYGKITLNGSSSSRTSFTFEKTGTSTKGMYQSACYVIGEYVDFKANGYYLASTNGSSFAKNSTYELLVLQHSGKLTINADSRSINITNSHINAMDNSYFIINTANPFKTTSAIDVCRGIGKNGITTEDGSVKKVSSIIELHADLDLGRLNFTKVKEYEQILLIDLNGNKITFSNGASNSGLSATNLLTSYEYTDNGTVKNTYAAKILIEDFANESVRFGTTNALLTNEDGSLKNVFWLNEAGEEIALYQNSDGWLYSPAVPEPAEWAMIFGAIALGFVAYRKRK